MKSKFFIFAWTLLTLLTANALADDAPAWLR